MNEGKNWIIQKLIDYNFDKYAVHQLYNIYKQELQSDSTKDSYRDKVTRIHKELINAKYLDKEVIQANIDLVAKNQGLHDKNRIKDKIYREQEVRPFNALAEYNKELIRLLDNKAINFNKLKIPKDVHINKNKFGILQLSDLHLNELVHGADSITNNYDFNIASRRLKKYVTKAKDIFKGLGINNILIAMTGDLLNSDRRYDEMFSMATNRSKATILSILLLEQVFLDFLFDKFALQIVGVVGNESRVNQDLSNIEYLASDNYDFTIFNVLRTLFKDAKQIKFIGNSQYTRQVIQCKDLHILITHGNCIKKKNPGGSINEIIAQYAMSKICLDYIICGHIHTAYISDVFSRSNGLVGNNAYAEQVLKAINKASQNLYIINEDKSIDVMRIDLQNTEGIIGYDISKDLELYSAKNFEVCKDKKLIVEVE